MQKFIYPLFALLSLSIFGCKKQNEIYPAISLIEPQQNESFDFTDTVFIKLFCKNCDQQPEVHLLNGSKIVALSKYVLADTDGNLYYQIILNGINMVSGEYTIRAIGYNGENSSAAFRDINYTALARELVGISMISSNSNSTTVSQFSFGSSAIHQVFGYKARLMATNSEQKIVVSASVNLGNLLGLNHLDLSQNYQLPNPSLPGLAQYQFLLSHDDLVYVFQNDGNILAIDKAGSTKRSFGLPQNKIAVCGSMDDNGLLVATKEEVGQNFILYLLNPQNGFVLKQVSMPGLGISMCSVGNNIYHILYQKSGVYYLAEYNSQTNNFTTIANIGSKKGNVIIRAGDAKSLIGMEDKVLLYDSQQSAIPSEVYSFGATDLDFDMLNGDVYIVNGSQVVSGKLGSATVPVYSATDSIFSIGLVYK